MSSSTLFEPRMRTTAVFHPRVNYRVNARAWERERGAGDELRHHFHIAFPLLSVIVSRGPGHVLAREKQIASLYKYTLLFLDYHTPWGADGFDIRTLILNKQPHARR